MKFLVSLLLFLVAENSLAQNHINLIKPNEVATILYLEKKDVVKYRCRVENQHFKNGNSKPKSTQIANYDLLLKVEESTDSSYVFQLTYTNVESEEGNDEIVSSIQTELLKSFAIRYCTDELGAYDSIINKKELIDVSLKCLDILEKKLSGNDAKKLEAVKQIITDEDNIEALFIEDINMIHNLYGIQAKLNEKIDFELEYPALVGISISGDGKFEITNIDPVRGTCTLRMDQLPNKEELDKLMEAIFFQLAGDDLDYSPRIKLTSTLNVSYKMDLSNGKMEQIKSKQVIRFKEEGKEAKRVITKTYSLQ